MLPRYLALARTGVYEVADLEMACNPQGRRVHGVRPHLSECYYGFIGCDPLARLEGIRDAIRGARAKPSQPVVDPRSKGGRELEVPVRRTLSRTVMRNTGGLEEILKEAPRMKCAPTGSH